MKLEQTLHEETFAGKSEDLKEVMEMVAWVLETWNSSNRPGIEIKREGNGYDWHLTITTFGTPVEATMLKAKWCQ